MPWIGMSVRMLTSCRCHQFSIREINPWLKLLADADADADADWDPRLFLWPFALACLSVSLIIAMERVVKGVQMLTINSQCIWRWLPRMGCCQGELYSLPEGQLWFMFVWNDTGKSLDVRANACLDRPPMLPRLSTYLWYSPSSWPCCPLCSGSLPPIEPRCW